MDHGIKYCTAIILHQGKKKLFSKAILRIHFFMMKSAVWLKINKAECGWQEKMRDCKCLINALIGFSIIDRILRWQVQLLMTGSIASFLIMPDTFGQEQIKG